MKKRYLPVAAYSMDGKLYKIYKTAIIAARELDVAATNIYGAVKRLYICKGFFWLRITDGNPPAFYRPQRHKEFGKKINVYVRPKKLIATTNTMIEAAKLTNVSICALKKNAREGKWCLKTGLFKDIKQDYFFEYVHPKDKSSDIHSVEKRKWKKIIEKRNR